MWQALCGCGNGTYSTLGGVASTLGVVWQALCGCGNGTYITLGGVASTVWVWQWYVQHSRGCGKHCGCVRSVGCGVSTVGVAMVRTAL